MQDYQLHHKTTEGINSISIYTNKVYAMQGRIVGAEDIAVNKTSWNP